MVFLMFADRFSVIIPFAFSSLMDFRIMFNASAYDFNVSMGNLSFRMAAFCILLYNLEAVKFILLIKIVLQACIAISRIILLMPSELISIINLDIAMLASMVSCMVCFFC